MNRRQFLRMLGAGAVTSFSPMVFCNSPKQRPNIIFFHTDSWDGRVLGCLDVAALKRATPNINRLAKRGVVLKNMYCSNPVCCPSRSSMWSGKHTFHCESWNNHKGLEPGANTAIKQLKLAGYSLASPMGGYGKHDYISGGHTIMNRVTAWTGPANIELPVLKMQAPKILENNQERIHVEDWKDVDRATDFLKENADKNKPFFLYLGIRAPHPPFTTSQKWLDMVDRNAITLPPQEKEVHPVMKYQRIMKNWRHGFTEKKVLNTRAIYYAMCAETDAMVGQVMDEMDRLGLADNTYFIFTSDHGENNMEHQQYYKMNMYESSVRVPFVVAGPDIKKNVIIDNIVSLVDVYPTLMDMAHISHPGGLDGESLLPLLTGKTKNSRNRAFSMFSGLSTNTTMFMLRKDNWKYIVYPGYKAQLFNVIDDPDEIDNLVEKRTDIVEDMHTVLLEIVDYKKIHKRCIDYDKSSFRQWRKQVIKSGIQVKGKKLSYKEMMQRIYMGWTEKHEKKLNDWLDQE